MLYAPRCLHHHSNLVFRSGPRGKRVMDWEEYLHRRNIYILSWYAMSCELCVRIQHSRRLRRGRKRRGSIRRRRRTFSDVTRYLTDKKFLLHFRTTRCGFARLLQLVKRYIEKNEDMGRLSSGGTLVPDVRLGMTLRMLAGASYLDCALAFSVEESTVTRIFYQTVRALNKVLKIRCN